MIEHDVAVIVTFQWFENDKMVQGYENSCFTYRKSGHFQKSNYFELLLLHIQ
jgi:hypothetical protein